MPNGVFSMAVSKDRNANSASNVLFYQLANNAGQVATITGGKLDVNATVVLETALVDEAIFGIGVAKVNAQGFLVDEVAPDSAPEGSLALARMTPGRIQLGVIADATTDSQRLAINVAGEAQVDLGAHALTNATPLPISANNTANNELNPIFVQKVDSVNSGEEIHDYNKFIDVAAGAVNNHDYTVLGATFKLTSVIVAASGRTQVEILVGPILSLVAKTTIFTDEDGFGQVNFNPAIEVPITGTGTVRVSRTNREGAAMDIFSTIMGYDI